MSQASQTAAAPANVLTQQVLFSLQTAKTAVATSGLSREASAPITDPIDEARRGIT